MNRRLCLAAAGATTLALAGCASRSPLDYAAERPRLELREYFNGKLVAHGIFTDRAGRVARRFVVHIDAHWEGDVGVLDEHFRFSDGEAQRRVWRLRRLGEGHYSGTAEDVVGEAQIQVAGNAMQLRYTLALPARGRVWHVQFDDWMVLIDDRVMLNRAVMSKFGIRLGEVTLAFTRL